LNARSDETCHLRGLGDAQLAVLARASADTAAYGILAERHYPSLRAFLLRMTGNSALAEDLAQDALLRGFERIAAFRGDAEFKTWLFSIAHREFLQSHRKAGVIGRMLERLTQIEPVHAAVDAADELDLCAGLSALREHERESLLLSDACGMSHSEIAVVMDAPLGSVKTWIRRARVKMQTTMGHDDVAGN